MDQTLSWVATAATIGGAVLTASNLGARVTGSGFAVFLVGSLAWLGVGAMTGQQALLWTNGVLTVLNVFGIWRWLGRQAKVEQGGKAAAAASEATPGEALFPVSMLAGVKVVVDGRDSGTGVDAMAGESSGRLAYLVVSEGGVAGLGERFRRIPWEFARVGHDRVEVAMTSRQFDSLPLLARDQWPAR